MAGLPTTLAGMTGFIIFVVFLTIMIVPNLNSQEAEHIKELQNDFNGKMNSTTNLSNNPNVPAGFWSIIGNALGLTGIYDFIIGFFQIIVSFNILLLNYLGIFFSTIAGIPGEFSVIFVIMASSLVIGIIKLIFFSGD